MAYSLDGGETWTRYAGNPVLDTGSGEFRDPKVFWHGGDDGRWVMVAVEAVDRRVLVYSSPDLIDWTFESDFGPAHAVGGVWECPDLFPLTVEGTGETKWVLVVSLNPGGIASG
ncbi:MAG TPA: levanase, partial [Longimicrobiaceae bacterium]|nr:levanase [Longimicrobiaceae bacterium]